MMRLKSFEELKSQEVLHELCLDLNPLDTSKLSGFVLFKDKNGATTEVWIEERQSWLAIAWPVGVKNRLYVIEIKKQRSLEQKFFNVNPRCSSSVVVDDEGKLAHVGENHRIFQHFEYLLKSNGRSTKEGRKKFFKDKTKAGEKLLPPTRETPVEAKTECVAVAVVSDKGEVSVKKEVRRVK